MSLQDAVAREAVLKALADRIGEEYKKARAEVQAELDANRGLQQVAALLPNGSKVGKVSLTDPEPKAMVTDPNAFLAWVRDEHPAGEDNIERRYVGFITEVRPAFAAALLAEMTAAKRAEWCDKETGVVYAVPGVEIKATRGRNHSLRFEDGGRDLVAEAFRAGLLAEIVLPQLTPAEGGDQ